MKEGVIIYCMLLAINHCLTNTTNISVGTI